MIDSSLLPSWSYCLVDCSKGAATGIALPVDVPYYLDICHPQSTRRDDGVGTLTTAIAPAIGPTYGGIMTSHFTWNHIFLFLVPVFDSFFDYRLVCYSRDGSTKSGYWIG